MQSLTYRLVAIICASYLVNSSAFFVVEVHDATSHHKLQCLTGSSIQRRASYVHIRHKIPTSLYVINPIDVHEELSEKTPLCDLQTFLRMCNLVESGGDAKTAIQNSQCLLNNVVETRRSKKLFRGDTVTFADTIMDVETEVTKKGYVYQSKVKKVKPLPRIDSDGNLEFGGRYRSEEWRAERKVKKAERKKKNQGS